MRMRMRMRGGVRFRYFTSWSGREGQARARHVGSMERLRRPPWRLSQAFRRTVTDAWTHSTLGPTAIVTMDPTVHLESHPLQSPV